MTEWFGIIVPIAVFLGFLVGLCMCTSMVFKIVFQVVDETYKKVYDKGVSDTLERLEMVNGNNKKNK